MSTTAGPEPAVVTWRDSAAAGAFDRIWCLGDVVGYGPEPNDCIELLRQNDLVCLAGNHDQAALGQLDLAEFNPDARLATLVTRRELNETSVAWLKTLPERVPEELGRYTLVHGSPRHPIWEYVLTPAIAHLNFSEFATQVCFMGHSHVPMIFRLDTVRDRAVAEPLFEDESLTLGPERAMVNPGSVGQPRDGDPRASFLVYDSGDGTVRFFRVEYDVKRCQDKIIRAGLPPQLAWRLEHGQ